MDITEYLEAVRTSPWVQFACVWEVDDAGRLRGLCEQEATLFWRHSTLTALAWARQGMLYEPELQWEAAAELLGLSLEDASEITGAEDADSRHLPGLRQALLAAVGVRPC